MIFFILENYWFIGFDLDICKDKCCGSGAAFGVIGLKLNWLSGAGKNTSEDASLICCKVRLPLDKLCLIECPAAEKLALLFLVNCDDVDADEIVCCCWKFEKFVFIAVTIGLIKRRDWFSSSSG